MNSFLCISVIAVSLAVLSAANYCYFQKKCKYPKTHTMCLYPGLKPARACGKVMCIGFSHAGKDEIVNTHNRLRQYVAAGNETRGNPGPQPAATNMKTLTWDNQIAEIAQRWANQCYWGHDDCRDVGRFHVGQNIGITMSTGTLTTKPSDIIQMWYDEVKDMDKNNVYKYQFATNTGHYTQVVWANTEKVGCGKLTYRVDGQNKYFLVCNYGPAGNFLGQPIYATKV